MVAATVREFGIAMLIHFAVNEFMYHHEKDIIERFSRYRTLYKRFIDEIFDIWVDLKRCPLQFISRRS